MWPHPNPGGGGMPPMMPTGYPASGAGTTPTNAYDWGAVAQQWLKNKEMYEQWQQQQYQAHLQMMANAHRAAMASSIDLTVVNNPPPPPPPPPPPVSDTSDAAAQDTPTSTVTVTTTVASAGSGESISPNSKQPEQLIDSASSVTPVTKSKFKSRFSNSALLKQAVDAMKAKELAASEHSDNDAENSNDGAINKPKPLFPGYESSLKVTLLLFHPFILFSLS